MGGFLFGNEVVCIKCNNFGTAVLDTNYLPASGSFIDMAGIDHGVFLIGLGAVDEAPTFDVKQDTAATVTGAVKDLATAASQLMTGTDDNKWATIEFNANQLDRTNGFHYVSLYVTGPTDSDDYYSVWFLGFQNAKQPVPKNANYAYHVSVVS
jgi:hypothetical protein